MKKFYIPVVLILIFVIGSFAYSVVNDPERRTTQTLEDVKDLPKEQCACWDSGKETCLPQQACQ